MIPQIVITEEEKAFIKECIDSKLFTDAELIRYFRSEFGVGLRQAIDLYNSEKTKS